MKRLAFAALVLMASVAAAMAQTVTRIGPITNGDCASFASPNTIQDGGFPCPGSGGTLNLPNGTTATTQGPGDSTTKVATDAYVENEISRNSTHFSAGGTSTGSANAQVIATTSPPVFSLTGNPTVTFNAGFSNTGAMTLNVVSTGVINVLKKTPTGLVALVTGDVIAGQQYLATYDGTQYELQTPSQVVTAQIQSGAVTNATRANMGANTWSGNQTGSTAAPADNSWPSCADNNGAHLNYVNGTGVTCGGTQATLSALQGKVEFVNDGTAVDMVLIPYNGNSMVLWCPATSSWNQFALPDTVSITGAANNGAGAIRITHAVSTRPFVTGQWVFISGVGGTTEANSGAGGAWGITVVDSTHFDLNFSAFVHTYTSGGTIASGVYARTDNITINGTASQAFVNTTTYILGLQFLDAGCTVAVIVAQTSLGVPNAATVMGFNILSAYTNTPLIGMCYKDATLGVQGNGSSELCLSWYNRNLVALQQTYTGNTGGTTGSPVALTNSGGAAGVVRFLAWSDFSPTTRCTASLTTTGVADMQVSANITGAQSISSLQGFHHAGTGVQQVTLLVPQEAQPAGEFNLALTLQTSANTATSGASFNTFCEMDVQF